MSIATAGPIKVSQTVGDREITFETGKLAKQADGSVVVRSGDTMVLATAQGRTEAREGARLRLKRGCDGSVWLLLQQEMRQKGNPYRVRS